MLNGEVVSKENKTILEEFIGNEVALLERKASKVDSKKNEEHEALMSSIKIALYNKGGKMTCSEIVKAVNTAEGADYSLNKISAMLTKMGEKGSGEVVKTMEKKVAYFTLAD
jgi:hypothetical protein